MIKSIVVADSISEKGKRLTTLQLSYQRFIHAEFMTHRQFSRNASSSRAIPVQKILTNIRENPATPLHWGKNQSGMQAKEEIPNDDIAHAHTSWLDAAETAMRHAAFLNSFGLHKQVVNRLIEPFSYISVVVTATEWDNWFNLRLHPDAQPEIEELARQMQNSLQGSVARRVHHGDWHLPYITENDLHLDLETQKKCSVARCARVSYKNHDNTEPDISRDIELHDRLMSSGHWSPFEHAATPIGDFGDKGVTHVDKQGDLWSGNFQGWSQYRHYAM